MEIDTVLFYNQIKLLCICLRLSPVGMKFENEGRGFLLGSPAFKLADELEFFRIMCRDQRIQRIVGMPKPMVDDDMGGFLTDQLLQDIFRFSVLGKTTAFFPSRVHKEYFRFPANHPCAIGKIFPAPLHGGCKFCKSISGNFRTPGFVFRQLLFFDQSLGIGRKHENQGKDNHAGSR